MQDAGLESAMKEGKGPTHIVGLNKWAREG
jgi:hypothetical protein